MDLLRAVNLRFYWGVCTTCSWRNFARRRNRCWIYRTRRGMDVLCYLPCSVSSVRAENSQKSVMSADKIQVEAENKLQTECVFSWKGIWFDCLLVHTWSGCRERLCGTSAQPSLPRRSLNGNLLLPESWKWEAEDNRIPTAVSTSCPVQTPSGS